LMTLDPPKKKSKANIKKWEQTDTGAPT